MDEVNNDKKGTKLIYFLLVVFCFFVLLPNVISELIHNWI